MCAWDTRALVRCCGIWLLFGLFVGKKVLVEIFFSIARAKEANKKICFVLFCSSRDAKTKQKNFFFVRSRRGPGQQKEKIFFRRGDQQQKKKFFFLLVVLCCSFGLCFFFPCLACGCCWIALKRSFSLSHHTSCGFLSGTKGQEC